MTKLKDYFNLTLVQTLAQKIQGIYPTFASDAFIDAVAVDLDTLELKDRSALIAKALRQYLPDDYSQSLKILLALLDMEHETEESTLSDDFQHMPLAHFVELYGLDHFELSMAAMLEITKRFTAEFCIRPFIERYPERTLKMLKTWTQDPNHHVRRLVSEGTRPRLPWASHLPAFIADPTPVLALLEPLKNDPSLYVRRSVANNLNDISKDVTY